MHRTVEGPKPVATWVRVLAWVIVACTCFAAVGVGWLLSQLGLRGVPWLRVAPLVLPVVWILPLFWIVALTARPPRRWLGFGTRLWQSGAEQRRKGL